MRIEAVRAQYLRLPDVRAIGDGSQDALLIEVHAGGFVGWGECEASPLTTIAALVAPLSHSACRPVLESVLGATLDGPDSIREINCRVRANGIDLLQTDHALSGIDIALWDLLGKREGAPVWSFFSERNRPKTGYASQLFGDTPEGTYSAARAVAATSFRAAKFGWGPIGAGSLEEDREQLAAAREGLGVDRVLLVDTGCVFDHDVERATSRIALFEEFDIAWWEEPFQSGALAEYSQLARQTRIPLAGGEGAHNADQAKHFIDYGRVGFIQIDAGRIGGITPAREVALYARAKGVSYVNHTFTSNLALSASLQPFADQDGYVEVPIQTSELACAIGGEPWQPDASGLVCLPESPGLGVSIDFDRLDQYRQEVIIEFNGVVIWPFTDKRERI